MYLASLAVDTTSADPIDRHDGPTLRIHHLSREREKLLVARRVTLVVDSVFLKDDILLVCECGLSS